MIATHNIKVNGRWISAGEEYGAKEAKVAKETSAAPVEEATETPKQKATASRRKKTAE